MIWAYTGYSKANQNATKGCNSYQMLKIILDIPDPHKLNQNSWAEHINESIPKGRLHVEGKDLRKFKGFWIRRGQKQLTREWLNVFNKSLSGMDYAFVNRNDCNGCIWEICIVYTYIHHIQ